MKLINKLVNSFQSVVWDFVIIPIADFFKLECDYCWWWRGVLVGSIFTSLILTLIVWVFK